ncbi:hypothetical protein SKAU_G00050990 [Synaphobranchus kaupii]|uniref:Uncharacterized protein n=1 Tax=Synaphobranchus kaupii TaxID=118154 RepID=A0A9Q1J7K8_SYNKA|nr:hypothetical protein SKAU_G00050990 [Synaphobranchus kaupii]
MGFFCKPCESLLPGLVGSPTGRRASEQEEREQLIKVELRGWAAWPGSRQDPARSQASAHMAPLSSLLHTGRQKGGVCRGKPVGLPPPAAATFGQPVQRQTDESRPQRGTQAFPGTGSPNQIYNHVFGNSGTRKNAPTSVPAPPPSPPKTSSTSTGQEKYARTHESKVKVGHPLPTSTEMTFQVRSEEWQGEEEDEGQTKEEGADAELNCEAFSTKNNNNFYICF